MRGRQLTPNANTERGPAVPYILFFSSFVICPGKTPGKSLKKETAKLGLICVIFIELMTIISKCRPSA